MTKTLTHTAAPASGFRGRTLALLAGAAVLAAGIGGYVAFAPGTPTVQSFGAVHQYVFIQSLETPDITLVDTSSDKVVGKITMPVQPDQLLVSNPLERIVVAGREAQQVLVYDLVSQSVVQSYDLDHAPDTLVMSPDGFNVIAADADAGALSVINIAEGYVTGTMDGFDGPANIAFSNDSEHAFVSDGSGGAVRVVSVMSGIELDPIRLSLTTSAAADADGTGLSALTRTPNGLFGMTVAREEGEMSVINFRSWQEQMTISVGADATRPYGTADGQYVMVASNADRTISVISTEYFDTEATLPGVSDVTSISTGYFETLAFVVSGAEQKAVIVDLTDMTLAGEIAFPGRPGPAVVDADGKKMYVALTDQDALAVVDVFSKEILTTIPNVGKSPFGVTLALTNNYCH